MLAIRSKIYVSDFLFYFPKSFSFSPLILVMVQCHEIFSLQLYFMNHLITGPPTSSLRPNDFCLIREVIFKLKVHKPSVETFFFFKFQDIYRIQLQEMAYGRVAI